MSASRKPGKGDQLRQSLQNPPESPSEPSESTQKPETGNNGGNVMEGFTVRLTRNQKTKIERVLWENHGEKLASGARRILIEWLNRNG